MTNPLFEAFYYARIYTLKLLPFILSLSLSLSIVVSFRLVSMLQTPSRPKAWSNKPTRSLAVFLGSGGWSDFQSLACMIIGSL